MKELPYHHKDPFDRMIIEAIEKKIAVMTDDLFFKNYPIKNTLEEGFCNPSYKTVFAVKKQKGG
jgi:enolase